MSTTMTSAEFKCLRESMGLTTKWLASRWDVSEFSVQRWERNRALPAELEKDMRSLKERFDREVARVAESGGDCVLVPRNDRLRTAGAMPAAWHRMVAQRASEKAGLRILFEDDEQEPADGR